MGKKKLQEEIIKLNEIDAMQLLTTLVSRTDLAREYYELANTAKVKGKRKDESKRKE